MKQISHARKQRQLRHLVKRLKVLSTNSQHNVQQQMSALLRKAKALVKELSCVLAPFHLRRILAPAALLLGVSFGTTVAAQSFTGPEQNPFNLIATYGYAFPTFADLDSDGDMDLLVSDAAGRLQYFRNVGTTTGPSFEAPLQNPFGLTTLDSVYVFPAFADLDHDGDTDLLLGNTYGGMSYYKNTGSAASPQFAAPLNNPFGLVSTDYFATPCFVDLDADGDLDLLVGEYGGNMKYFKNTGTASSPAFAAPEQNPFGITSAYGVGFASFADLDNDGDLDLLLGEYYGNMQYAENIGTATIPQFAMPQQNPFGLVETSDLACPAFVDLDGDGDMDLLVGEYSGNMQYYENKSGVGIHEQNVNIVLELNPNPVADVLNIQTDMPFEKLEAYDAMGKLFRSYYGTLTSINVSDWNSGTYVLKFIDVKGQFVARKVMKE